MNFDYEPSVNRRKFVAALGKLLAPMEAAQAVNALMAFLPGIYDLDEAMFERPGELAIDIATKFRSVPSYGPLRKALDEWWASHRRPLPALPGAADAGLDATEESWVRGWRTNSGVSEGMRTVMLSTIRQYSPRAFMFILRTDDGASSIAARQGWLVERVPAQTDEDRAAVSALVRRAVQAARASSGFPMRGVDRPDHEFIPAPARKPKSLSAEQIREMRRNNPTMSHLADLPPPREVT